MPIRYPAAAIAAAFMIIMSPAEGRPNPDREDTVERAPLAVQSVDPSSFGLRDEASMVLVGTGLLVLAAAVRRSA